MHRSPQLKIPHGNVAPGEHGLAQNPKFSALVFRAGTIQGEIIAHLKISSHDEEVSQVHVCLII